MAANTDISYDLSLKFVLLGEDDVGKTCIMNRYVKDMFADEPSTSKVLSNIGL